MVQAINATPLPLVNYGSSRMTHTSYRVQLWHLSNFLPMQHQHRRLRQSIGPNFVRMICWSSHEQLVLLSRNYTTLGFNLIWSLSLHNKWDAYIIISSVTRLPILNKLCTRTLSTATVVSIILCSRLLCIFQQCFRRLKFKAVSVIKAVHFARQD